MKSNTNKGGYEKTSTDDKVQLKLCIWGDASVQKRVQGTVRNSHVFDKIMKELESKGFKCDEKQCWKKLKQLKKVQENGG